MKYTALTIGPIYKTFTYAKKTREMWAASYMFSYLMKKLIMALKKADMSIEIIIPFTDDKLLQGKNETGLFPDRLVFKTKLSIKEIKKINEDVLFAFVDEISSHTGSANKNYFNNYFQIYVAEKKFSDNVKKCNVVKSLFDTLDVLELQQKYQPIESSENIRSFLTKASFKQGKQHSFLMQDARDVQDNDIVKFQSLIEISAVEIINKLDDNTKKEFEQALKDSFNSNKTDDNSLVNILKKHPDFRTHHKYIAILQIDGDRFGKINQHLDDNDFQKFSESLAKYSMAVKDIITGYGGLPVYIGGDDVMAFVPVRNGEQNIFTIIKEIDNVFEKEFDYFIQKKIKDKDGNEIIPSLSVGVSVTYYKYPLKEALDLSYHMLFDVAKKYNNKIKNTIAFEVIKHSGQTFGTVFEKKSNTYKEFNELIKLNIDDEQFFSSVIQKFFENFKLLEIIGKSKERIHSYRREFFNETFHGTKDIFLDKLESYISKLFQVSNNNKDIQNKLYASLRMVKFLNREDNE